MKNKISDRGYSSFNNTNPQLGSTRNNSKNLQVDSKIG